MRLLQNRFAILAAIVAVAIVPASVQSASGHEDGPGLPIISFSDMNMNVTVSISLSPSDITVDDIDDINMKIRFFDTLTYTTLEQVTYRIEIWRGGDLLARNLFFDRDGTLDVKIRPVTYCDKEDKWRCTIYEGTEHVNVPGALYVEGEQCTDNNIDTCARPTITGPIFEQGGLYNIRVDIVGAINSTIQLENELRYETFVSVAQEQDFIIQTAHAEEIPVIVKTYYDVIKNFKFDTLDNSITFDMDFDWSPDYVDLVPVVHQHVRVPKTFVPYGDGKQFCGYVNGVEIDQRALFNDPYAYNDTNVLHFLITNKELQNIRNAMSTDQLAQNNMNFKLVPLQDGTKSSTEFYLVDLDSKTEQTPTNVNISWDTRCGAGDTIPFTFTFFDENRQLINDVWYSYEVRDADGNVIAMFNGDGNAGIATPEGTDTQKIDIPSTGLIRIDVIVYGTGLDYDPTYAGIGSGLIEIGTSTIGTIPDSDTGLIVIGDEPQSPSYVIPSWIKTNAGWWADGTINDTTFIHALEYLIQNDILVIPSVGDDPNVQQQRAQAEIPSWIKTNAGWWADGEINDATFVSGIQYLIKNGIVNITPTSSTQQ